MACVYGVIGGRIASWCFKGNTVENNKSWEAGITQQTEISIKASIQQLRESWIMNNQNEVLSLDLFAWVDSQKCTPELKQRLENGDHAENIKKLETLWNKYELVNDIIQKLEDSAKNQTRPDWWDDEEFGHQLDLMKLRMYFVLSAPSWNTITDTNGKVTDLPFVSILQNLKNQKRLQFKVTWIIGTNPSDWNQTYAKSRQAGFNLSSK